MILLHLFIFAALSIMIQGEDVMSNRLNHQHDHKNAMEIDINLNINLVEPQTESEFLRPKARSLGSKAQSQSGRALSNIINREFYQNILLQNQKKKFGDDILSQLGLSIFISGINRARTGKSLNRAKDKKRRGRSMPQTLKAKPRYFPEGGEWDVGTVLPSEKFEWEKKPGSK